MLVGGSGWFAGNMSFKITSSKNKKAVARLRRPLLYGLLAAKSAIWIWRKPDPERR